MIAPRVPRLLHDSLLASAERRPTHEAVADPDERLDFAALADRAMRLAAGLQARGLRRGDRVAILLDNGVPAVVAVYAAMLAGGAFVLLHPHTRPDKLRFLLRDCGAAAAIVNPRRADDMVEVQADAPDLRTVIVVSDATAASRDAPVPNGAVAAEELSADAGAWRRPGTIPLDLAALIYTSGSTGMPKGVMLSHQSMRFVQESLCEYLRLDESDRILNVLPLSFDYGLYQAFMAVHLGATLALERSFGFPAQVVRRLQDERVTVLPGVPTIFATLLSLSRRTPFRLPDVRRITNTAAHLPDAHVTQLHELCPNALIYRMYGLTECKRVAYLEPELALTKPRSVGKAIPGTEAFVLDAEGHETPPGVPGILHVRGPHVMMGYWNRPEETARMLVPGRWPGERMLCTHDLFTTDEEGFLYFVGRTDDVIKRGGEKVSPLEIENALHAVPGVREAAVIGVPDPLLGEAVRAFVVPDAGAELTERSVKQAVAELLEPMLVPRDVVITDDLPRTSSGKVRKRDLRETPAEPVTEDVPVTGTVPVASAAPVGTRPHPTAPAKEA